LKHKVGEDFYVTGNKYGQIVSGWLQGCKHVLSPNCAPRPPEASVRLLVIHNISLPPGEFGGPHIEALFTNTLDSQAHEYFAEIAHLNVSAHFLIRRDGEVIQFVATTENAWHAGVSSWRGFSQCNDFSIGIELEGTDTHVYSEVQYVALEALVKACRQAHPDVEPTAIVGHSDVAPGRKTDPGPGFDWHRLSEDLGVGELPGI
jgi:AmpD protein